MNTNNNSSSLKQIGPINPIQYITISANSSYKKKTNQQYDMIIINECFFKRVNNTRELSIKLKFPYVYQVYKCSHDLCNCILYIYLDKSAELINQHNFTIDHFQDPITIQRLLFKWFVIDKLEINQDQTPVSIITEFVSQNQITEYSPSKKYMCDTISSLKRHNLGKIPNSVDEIDLEKLKQIDDKFTFEFIPYQDGMIEKKCLIFYNEFQLNLMKNHDLHLLADSTFSVCPKIYFQFMIIHILIGTKAFAVAFILCPNKSKNMYKEVFIYFKNKNLHFLSLKIDHEKAPKSAAHEVFPECFVSNCWFHFAQAIIRNMKQMKLTHAYSSNVKVILVIKFYISLAFCDVDKINNYLKVIYDEILSIEEEEIKKLMIDFHRTYFVPTWVNGQYKVDDWCQLNDLINRSNNWCEAFHSGLVKRFHQFHPNIIKLFIVISKYTKYEEFLFSDYLTNPNDYINKKIESFNEKLKTIVERRNTVYKNKEREYLIAISNINCKLLIKINNCLRKFNRFGWNDDKQKTYKEITDIMDIVGDDEINQDEMRKRMQQLDIVTKYHQNKINSLKELKIYEKENEEININIVSKKKTKKIRSKKKEIFLDENELSELSQKLSEICSKNNEESLIFQSYQKNDSQIFNETELSISSITMPNDCTSSKTHFIRTKKLVSERAVFPQIQEENSSIQNNSFISDQINLFQENENQIHESEYLSSEEIEEIKKPKRNENQNKSKKNKKKKSKRSNFWKKYYSIVNGK